MRDDENGNKGGVNGLDIKNAGMVLEAIKDGIAVVDDAYRLVYVNKAALEVVGIEDKEGVIGKACYEVFFKKTAPCGWCKCEECFKTGQSQYTRLALPLPSGEERVFQDETIAHVCVPARARHSPGVRSNSRIFSRPGVAAPRVADSRAAISNFAADRQGLACWIAALSRCARSAARAARH